MRRVGQGPVPVLWIGGIHGDEPEGALATVEIASLVQDDPGLMAGLCLDIIEDLNPDGRAAQTRGNARGVDLNRDWPATCAPPTHPPLSQPESRALHAHLRSHPPVAVLVLHSWADPGPHRRFVNPDGAGGPLADRFARATGWPIQASDHLHPTPGSLGAWLGRDQGLAMLTIEFERGVSPATCWRDSRSGFEAVLRHLATKGGG